MIYMNEKIDWFEQWRSQGPANLGARPGFSGDIMRGYLSYGGCNLLIL